MEAMSPLSRKKRAPGESNGCGDLGEGPGAEAVETTGEEVNVAEGRVLPGGRERNRGSRGGRYVQWITKAAKPADDPYASWNVRERYEADWKDEVPLDAARRRRALHRQVLMTLQQAELDGVVK
jgi:hypothetical protein